MKDPDSIIREFLRLAKDRKLTTDENAIYTADTEWLINDAKAYLGEE